MVMRISLDNLSAGIALSVHDTAFCTYHVLVNVSQGENEGKKAANSTDRAFGFKTQFHHLTSV